MGRVVSHLGESILALNGLWMKIIGYRRIDDIDVQFEDGVIVTNKTYKAFRAGKIAHPNINSKLLQAKKKYIGKEVTNSQGLKAVILDYRGYGDIDVGFEDGTIVKHKQCGVFLKGLILNPNKEHKVNFKHGREGTEVMMSCGLKAKCIRYGGWDDVDVKFEDGTVVKKVKWRDFDLGYIHHPKIGIYRDRVGEIGISRCGLRMRIINYIDKNNLDIQYEDGEVVKGRTANAFKAGTIGHPNLSLSYYKDFHMFKKVLFAFRCNLGVFYYCITPDNERLILTPQQMMERSGVNPVF